MLIIDDLLNLEMEIWKPIIGYEGLYEVSNLGRVKSLKNGRWGYGKERILSPGKSSSSYFTVNLCKNNKNTSCCIHRLVAEVFIPNPKNKRTVNHINGIKDDNKVENLEWATDSEQMFHAFEIGLKSPIILTDTHKQKLKQSTEVVSTWINKKLNLEFIGNSCELARAFPEQKLDHSNLRSLRLGKRAQHKGWTIKP